MEERKPVQWEGMSKGGVNLKWEPTVSDLEIEEDYIRKDIDHFKGRCEPDCEFCIEDEQVENNDKNT